MLLLAPPPNRIWEVLTVRWHQEQVGRPLQASYEALIGTSQGHYLETEKIRRWKLRTIGVRGDCAVQRAIGCWSVEHGAIVRCRMFESQ